MLKTMLYTAAKLRIMSKTVRLRVLSCKLLPKSLLTTIRGETVWTATDILDDCSTNVVTLCKDVVGHSEVL